MAEPFRYAICNEFFGEMPFAESCRIAREAGFEGMEIAPFTLSENPATLPVSRRKEIRRAMEGEGLCMTGLHWLLRTPPGLHLTTGDVATRQRSWDYLRQLAVLASDLAVCRSEYNAVLVLGSPQQRGTVNGMSRRDATNLFTHELAHTAGFAETHGVRILVEALSPDQTDVINTLAEAVDVVRQIGSPAVQTMFDSHNAVAETDPQEELIRRYAPYIQHVHLNENDGAAPGEGSYNFAALLSALQRSRYSGWLSLEVLTSTGVAAQRARQSLRFLHRVEPKMASAQAV